MPEAERIGAMSTHERPVAPAGSIGWSLVVPVKPAAVGKSRLAPFAGGHRADLARAMAIDTITAALASPRVVELLAITPDPEFADVLARLGAVAVTDEPAAGLNAALLHGARLSRSRRPDGAVAAMLADLPALRPNELTTALDAASAWPTSFVPDAAGVGTTLYCAAPGVDFAPRFGGPSRRAHLDAGAVELTPVPITSVRRDVDTGADLHQARDLGVGPRTRAALAAMARRGDPVAETGTS
ncbi:2-phospho-L-lactate guanylyltransferase [Actinopolymorpha rutila]